MFGFGKKKTVADDNKLYTPVTGEVIQLENVSDPVFAGKMMGDGFAVEPTEGTIVSPVAGKVTIQQEHAVGLERADGLEILVHIGIDTVSLNGAPFTPNVKVGDVVDGGDTLATVDWQQVDDAKLPKTTMVLITNSAEKLDTLSVEVGNSSAGSQIGQAVAIG